MAPLSRFTQALPTRYVLSCRPCFQFSFFPESALSHSPAAPAMVCVCICSGLTSLSSEMCILLKGWVILCYVGKPSKTQESIPQGSEHPGYAMLALCF